MRRPGKASRSRSEGVRFTQAAAVPAGSGVGHDDDIQADAGLEDRPDQPVGEVEALERRVELDPLGAVELDHLLQVGDVLLHREVVRVHGDERQKPAVGRGEIAQPPIEGSEVVGGGHARSHHVQEVGHDRDARARVVHRADGTGDVPRVTTEVHGVVLAVLPDLVPRFALLTLLGRAIEVDVRIDDARTHGRSPCSASRV